MGKQKSFILVGSIFLGFIVIMLLVTLITSNIKDTKIYFDSSTYYVEVDKSRALTPTIYAGGKVVDDVTFTYESADKNIFDTKPGCFSVGTASVDCWAFVEAEADGTPVTKTTVTPYNEEDVVEIKYVTNSSGKEELYWHVNGEKTRAKANKMYTEEEIEGMLSKKSADIECFYLNGMPTNIPYNSKITPERNEETGTWFIDGEDTGIGYEGIPSTIYGLQIGSAQITAKGTIDGKEFSLTATIVVCEPDPTTIVYNYIDETIVVNLNKEFAIDYTVKGNSETALPKQAVKYVQTSSLVFNDTNKTYKAEKVGEYSIKLIVDEKSFQLSTPASISKAVKVVVLDTGDEQIELINQARVLINEIGALNSEGAMDKYLAAKEIVSQIEEANLTGITNYNKYESAQKKFENTGA